mmetsp:Transcript_139070/g.444134  ORF Transcript_139070/g.444134 Transcript_139070/m.444134 type:complete len:311 (-) Transcript_139070:97-1029(-)|eukprot:CAMPEP_0203969746 /NCGR_PEP_ID=MMETSP0359-20131031/97614_1 /ASSEMBLY_ACC=CAM_ASM_000338 /TAXON_ID=268821 /ORGANISM="Scrippsiella Hangoei, Strain SHTV-5" /LENGTH=310 /DNA_ID=CAMNT_0050907689 /DNA_START=139 /DNA_END=1071 /DNA_ORIENTATION=+
MGGACEAGEDDADLRQYGASLGVDSDFDSDLQWIAQEAFDAALPASWSEHTDDEGRLYFFREASGESSWEHPMDAVYRELVDLVKQARYADSDGDDSASVESSRATLIHSHLRQVHQRALDTLEGWSGPYTSAEGEYYYNTHLKVSAWESPLAEWTHEILLRHSVLCRCLLPDRAVVGANGTVERLPEAGQPQVSGAELLQALQLPLELLRRGDSDGSDVPRTPSTSRDFYTARSGCSTTRSQISTTRSGGERLLRGHDVADSTGGAEQPVVASIKRSPKRAPKPTPPQERREPPPDTVTIFTRPDAVAR